MLREDRIVVAVCVSVLVVTLALFAPSAAAETDVEILTHIRTQLQDLLLLQWGNLATNLVLVAFIAALLGGQR